MKTEIRNSISGLLLIPLMLGCFALLPSVQAAPDPAPPPGANTRDGAGAMASITTGNNNSAFGTNALNKLTIGNNNAAQGNSALFSNVDGSGNVALGSVALRLNVDGNHNTAIGNTALNSNVGGDSNTALGYGALRQNISGNFNIAIGELAGLNITMGSSNIVIGNLGSPGENNATRIGTQGTQTATYIAGIFGINEGGTPAAVFINNDGKLGTTPPASSRRFKKEIKPMGETSDAILGLKPVTFNYKSDSKNTPQFGLIAEEVAEVNPDLVVRDEKGEIYTVRYEAVNAMLLNEFLKEHRKNEEQEKTIAELKSGMTALAATVKEQASQIQKVSAQLEASKPAPQVVNNNQ